MRRIGVSGGPPERICATAREARGGAWGSTGTILFGSLNTGLFRVPESGGTATLVSGAGPTEIGLWPSFLPDGDHFVYLARSERPDGSGTYVGSLTSPTRTRLLDEDRGVTYIDPGYLLFVRGQTMMVQPFDPSTLTVTGSAKAMVEPVATSSNGHAAFSVSRDGSLVFAGAEVPSRQLAWVDRAGRVQSRPAPPNATEGFRLSLDGTRVISTRIDLMTQTQTVWRLDTQRNAESRVAGGHNGIESPDSRWVTFGQQGSTARTPESQGLYRIAATGEGEPEQLVRGSAWPTDWSSDGRRILFQQNHSATGFDLFAYDMTSRAVTAVLETSANEGQARFSPDDRWIAYVSIEGGRPQVFVRPSDGKGTRTLISADSGTQPRWRRDGKELFYLSADNDVVSVNVRLEGDTPTAATPQQLFLAKVQRSGSNPMFGQDYDVVGDY